MFIKAINPGSLLKKILFFCFIFLIGFTIYALPSLNSLPVLSLFQNSSVMGDSNQHRLDFLRGFGWEVHEEPEEIVPVIIPEKFGKVYENYNELQREQGFDLKKFQGKEVRRYTYEVTNYPQQKKYIRANLLVFKGKIIGGDICSIYVKDGFMHGFQYPKKEQSPTPSCRTAPSIQDSHNNLL